MVAKGGEAADALPHAGPTGGGAGSYTNPQGAKLMTKKTWKTPKVETTPVSMEVTMYLPAQA